MLNPSPLPDEASTLFLGDLSVFCTEKDIRKLFRPFGPIEAIRVKRGTSNKTNLSYGFIKFALPESAEQARQQLNGVMFLGRGLRIGWAEGKNPNKISHSRDEKKIDSAQVHVSFISKQVDVLISEATLRGLFSLYGEVTDVALKKSQFDRNLKIQNGYGFVHYPLTQEGIRSAITAVHSLHQVTIDRVTYDCSVSHALEELLGPTNIEDNPGAVPLNDRGFCLPANTAPVVLRLPTAIPLDPNPPFAQQPQRGNYRNAQPQHQYPSNVANYQIESPGNFLPMNNNQFQNYGPGPGPTPTHYNVIRPPLPPTSMYPQAPLMMPPNIRPPSAYLHPPMPMPLPQQQPLYASTSVDSYESLLAATERLTIRSSQDTNHHWRDNGYNSRDSNKRDSSTLSSGVTSQSSFDQTPVTTPQTTNFPAKINLQSVYTNPADPNGPSKIFEAKNYYF